MRTGVIGEGSWSVWIKGWTRSFSDLEKSPPEGQPAKRTYAQGVFTDVAKSAPSCSSISAQRAFSPKCS